MNFINAYPSYQQARQAFVAFVQKREELSKFPGLMADITNLVIHSGPDTHKFLFVPVRVSIDSERLVARIGFISAQPLMEELANEMTRELTRLMEIIHSSGVMEAAHGIRSAEPAPIQAPNVAPAGGTGDGSAFELGAKITSGPTVLPSGSDV